MNKNEMLVAAIENGTVIDHIPTEKTYQVVNLLEAGRTDHTGDHWLQLHIQKAQP